MSTHTSPIYVTLIIICVSDSVQIVGDRRLAGPVLLHKHRVLQQHQEDEELTRLSSVVSVATHSTQEMAGLLENPK